MMQQSLSTPLVSLETVAIDTETTGLDARSARIVQIGAVRLSGAEFAAERFDRLVNPTVPIPAQSRKVHGISDADVANASRFPALWTEFEQFIAGRVVVGHTVAFDLEVLMRETKLAGIAWSPPRALDVRLMARIAAPSLADYSLDRLADWLGVSIRARHSGLGDALAAAEIYVRLLPRLREKGIRTLAELDKALLALAEREAERAGGLIAAAGPLDRTQPRQTLKLDGFIYANRVRDVMSAPPAFIEGRATVAQAISQLIERRISSVFVRTEGGEVGIVTERDLLRAIDRGGGGALTGTVESIMSKPLHTIAEDAFMYRAIGRMDRLGLRHLAVRDRDGGIVGAVTPRNLLRQRAAAAIAIGDEIDKAGDVAALGAARGKLPDVAASLIGEGLDGRSIAAIISSELCILTRRAAQIAESRLQDAGRGPPPQPYAVLVLGSGGRGESLLAADQDNAIVYAGDPDAAADAWFKELGGHIADILDSVGVPYCKGGVMARNDTWRQSVAGWHETVGGWLRRSTPKDLLNVDIFFDSQPVHGDLLLGEALWREAYQRASSAPDFLNLLVEGARDFVAPLTIFGGFKTEGGRVDLKKGGLLPIVSGARVLSIKHGILERATVARLRGVIASGVGDAEELEAVIDAHGVILHHILDQQLIDGERGVPLTTLVDIRRLSPREKSRLKQAIRTVDGLMGAVGEGRL